MLDGVYQGTAFKEEHSTLFKISLENNFMLKVLKYFDHNFCSQPHVSRNYKLIKFNFKLSASSHCFSSVNFSKGQVMCLTLLFNFFQYFINCSLWANLWRFFPSFCSVACCLFGWIFFIIINLLLLIPQSGISLFLRLWSRLENGWKQKYFNSQSRSRF